MILKIFKKTDENLFLVSLTLLSISIWYIFLGTYVIDQPYIWDDLHMIRSYSSNEIIQSWVGNWDPDGIETPSYRPVAILFYNFLGGVFGENTFLGRIFIFLLMSALLFVTLKILREFNFSRLNLLIFLILLIFSKIFSTLLSWFTLSALLFCYVLALTSFFYFIKWLRTKKKLFYYLSLFLCFLSIFTREEMYFLPGFFFVIFFFEKNFNQQNLKQSIISLIPFLIIVATHLYLRKIFVIEAAYFEITASGIKYGGETLGLGYFIKALKSSFLPMGYWSINKIFLIQTISFLIWIISIFTILYFYFILTDTKKYNFKNILLILLMLFFLCLPNIIIGRSFGILMPTFLSLSLISLLITKIVELSLIKKKSKMYKNFLYILNILILLSGVVGGYDRSKKHIDTMNEFSYDIVLQDSKFIFEYPNLTIPKQRYEKKYKHLRRLGILNIDDVNKLSLNLNTKIKKTDFNPLSF